VKEPAVITYHYLFYLNPAVIVVITAGSYYDTAGSYYDRSDR